jgi:competence protein ComEA
VRVVTLKKYLLKTSRLDKVLIVLALIGAIVALISLFRGILRDSQVQVEYLASGNLSAGELGNKIFVDIEGGVMNSGVYELPDGSRIKDVLVMAGGLSDRADREFCEKNLNMAEVVKDGQKIYIPEGGNTDALSGYSEAILSSKKISINSATVAELDTLWGIGSARAESIVKNRPYQSVDELVSKGVLTQSLVDKNKELLSVF